MKKFIFSLVILVWTVGCFAQTPDQSALSQGNGQRSDLERLVKQAFAAAKPRRFKDGSEARNVTLIFELPRTPEIIPLLKPYLDNGDGDERSYVVSLLDKIPTPASVELLLRGLDDSESFTAEQAAGSLFKNYDREFLTGVTDLKNTIYNSVRRGKHSVPAYLLLGYFPGAETAKILDQACRDRARTNVNQSLERPKARRMLVACAVSSDFGSKKGDLLLEKFRTDFQLDRSYFFLLDNLELIESPDVLNVLFQKMAFDASELYPVIDNPPRRRVMGRESQRVLDLAVNKFAARLRLEVGFEPAENKRYSQVQLIRARRLIQAEIARLERSRQERANCLSFYRNNSLIKF